MKPLRKPKPRMVSWIQYLAYLSAKLTLRLAGMGAGIVGVAVCLICAALFVVWTLMLGTTLIQGLGGAAVHSIDGIMLALGVIIVGGCVGAGLLKAGAVASTKSEDMELVVPMTQNRAANLPAEDSLVRAASEPTHPQQEVLLRPAQSSDETPADQLLRPHG